MSTDSRRAGPRFVCWLWSAALVVFSVFALYTLLAPMFTPLALLPAMALATVVTLPIVEKRRERLAVALACGVVAQLLIAYSVLHLAQSPCGSWQLILAIPLWVAGVVLPFGLGTVVVVTMIRDRRADRRMALPRSA